MVPVFWESETKRKSANSHFSLDLRILLRDTSCTMKINAQQTPPADHDLLGDQLRLRGELALLGWASLTAWGRAHGFEQSAISHALRTWGRRNDGRGPHGKNSSAIIDGLVRTVHEQKRPGGDAS